MGYRPFCVFPGRRVTLARGYGWPRLDGVVGEVFAGPLDLLMRDLPLTHVVPDAADIEAVVAAVGAACASDTVVAFEVRLS